MNIQTSQVNAVKALGYTEAEAQFLYLVASHSGYFLGRQFLGFTGAHWGKRTALFWNKLQAKQHVRLCRFAPTGTVFSLCSPNIYRLAGQDRIRNLRDHELNYIQTRIGILDFVLQNLDNRYLETETKKLTYFCSEKKVPANELPSRAFGGRYLAKPTVLYFTDGNPIFFTTESAPVETVTFSYFHGAEINLAGFTRHLQSHMPLFYRLERFNFCFLARSDVRFDKAAELFRDIVTIPLQSNPAEDLLRYFAIRKAWNLSQYSSLTEGDLIFRNNAKERFRGERFENLYRAWKSNRTPESEIRSQLGGSDKPHTIHFQTQIVEPVSNRKAATAVDL